MMSRVLDDTVTLDFTTNHPATGQASDASAVSSLVFEADSDTPILTLIPVKRTGQTGNYRVTFAASAANGFEVGKSYNVVVEATVAGVTAKARIASFSLKATLEPKAHFRI